MKFRWSCFLIASSIVLVTLVLGCSSNGAAATTAPKTTTTASQTTTPTTTVGQTTTSSTIAAPTTTTSNSGGTLSIVAIDITTHNAAQMASYKGLCKMCHGPGTTNSNPYPPTWNGKANGSTANTGTYTIVAGSTIDHTPYTDDQCTQAGCHVVPGSSTTPPATTSTAPATTTTAAPPTTTTTSAPVSTRKVIFDGSTFSPNNVSISKGLFITFENPQHSDSTIICVDSTGKKVFTLALPEGEDTECPDFTVAGVYTISDQANPLTKMTVTVT